MGKVIRKKGEGMTALVTHDTGMAIALLTKGHELIDIYPNENSEYNDAHVYHFKFTPHVERDADAFLNGQLLINAKSLFKKMYELSARTYGISDESTN